MIDNELRKAFRFFFENAGYCVGRRAEGALQLARAERWAREEGAEVAWVDDNEVWDGDCPAPDMVLGCTLKVGDEEVSLWGIGLNHAYRKDMILHRGLLVTPYQRVVEAELALEAMEPFFEAIANHVRSL
jgi:hypothetical protein